MILSILAGLAGFVLGSWAPGEQHRLYREAEFKRRHAHGMRLIAMRVLLGVAMAICFAIACRPDHYDLGARLLTSLFVAVLLVLASTDLERRRIPDRLSLPAMVVAIVFCWAWPDRSIASIALGTGVAFGLASLFFGLGLFVGGGALGMGDAKLMVLLGLICGWPAALTAILVGALLAGIPAVVLVLAGRRRSYFSYGPYLVAGGLLVLLFPGGFV
jgi:Flp pilus assembly protein protease CpaA